ncbi:hypothetical protein [Streptomyces sp. NPDC026673]|uniref:hypothetical protein n=1 Tax=Streptomyces sp. NPDC026673 TaxID=3155724 RepID=UPI0033F87C23
MANEAASAAELGFLLGLVEPEQAERARRRTGLPADGPARAAERPEHLVWGLRWHQLPSSVLWWMLQEDDPRINALVYRHGLIDDRVRHDILTGVPYGPDRTRRVRVDRDLSRLSPPELPRVSGPDELTAALRAVTTMGAGRTAALMVGREEWAVVAAADREEPLPGYARWALATRADCPPEVRAQFGTHRKFTHRLRVAGVVDGPATYATATRPARDALRVLAVGRWAFARRADEAAGTLRPLVRAELGGNTEAWAVLAQLLPTFSGTHPELITTAGAIAGGAGAGPAGREPDDEEPAGPGPAGRGPAGRGGAAGESDGPLSVGSGNTESQGDREDSGRIRGGRTWDSTSGRDGGPSSASRTGGRWSSGVRRIRASWRRRDG